MPAGNGFEESWVGPRHRSRLAFQYQPQLHAATLDLQWYEPRGSEPRNGWNDLRNQWREVESYLNSVLVQIDPLDRLRNGRCDFRVRLELRAAVLNSLSADDSSAVEMPPSWRAVLIDAWSLRICRAAITTLRSISGAARRHPPAALVSEPLISLRET